MTETANIIRITIVCEGEIEVESFRKKLAEFILDNDVEVRANDGIHFTKIEKLKNK